MSAGGAHLKDEGSQWQVTTAGAIAGLISRFCIAPLDVVKIRLQLQTTSHEGGILQTRGTIQTARDIFVKEGIRGFWRGNVPAEFLYVSYGAAQFTAYRTTAKFFDSCSLPSWLSSFLSGGTAGAAATAVTYPLDLLRTRFAAQGTSKVYTSVLGSIRSIYHEEGPKGFFRGLPVTVGQIAPYMGLFFSTYEAFRPLTAQLPLPFGSNDAVAGIMASTVSKTGVFPLDLLRRRMQVQGPFRKQFAGGSIPEYERGVWRVAKTVIANEGWRGLYKGLSISLVKAAPASAVTMWTYEHALKTIQDVS